jgi:hypothetical protein
MVDVTARLPQNQARKVVAKVLAQGVVRISRHAREEMANDRLGPIDQGDVNNVLRLGQMTEPCELKNGTWRYRVHTERFCVVVAFRSEEELVVVTAWRKKS